MKLFVCSNNVFINPNLVTCCHYEYKRASDTHRAVFCLSCGGEVKEPFKTEKDANTELRRFRNHFDLARK